MNKGAIAALVICTILLVGWIGILTYLIASGKWNFRRKFNFLFNEDVEDVEAQHLDTPTPTLDTDSTDSTTEENLNSTSTTDSTDTEKNSP